MDPIFLSIGGFEIRYYGLMYAIAFLVGIRLCKIQVKGTDISAEEIENYAFVAIISGLLGGRLYYVLFNLSYYLSHPSEILAVWNGGMAIHGGTLGGLLGTYIYGKVKKINFLRLGDIAAPALILGQAIGRIGNLMNGEVHGVPTFTPWKVIFSIKPSFTEWYSQYNLLPLMDRMNFNNLVPWGLVFPESSPAGSEFPNLSLHPAMLYELVLNLIGFFILWFVVRKRNYRTGTVIWSYIIIYSVIRIFVSFFRAEDLMVLGLRAPHLISLILIGISAYMIYRGNNKKKA